MQNEWKEGQFLLFADGKQIGESFTPSELINKQFELEKTGIYKSITILKVIMHSS